MAHKVKGTYGLWADVIDALPVSDEFLERVAASVAMDSLGSSDPNDGVSEMAKYEADLDEVVSMLCRKYDFYRPDTVDNIKRNGQSMDSTSVQVLGITVNDRKHPRLWGQCQIDRCNHMHVLGPSGSGKSVFLKSQIVQDIWFNRGGFFIDPHGDLADDVLRLVPPYRIKDTVYMNFSDPEYSFGVNPLYIPGIDRLMQHDPALAQKKRSEMVESVVDLFMKYFNVSSENTVILKNLRNAINVLSHVPGATLLEIMPLFHYESIRDTCFSFVPEGPEKDTLMQTITEIAESPKSLQSLENRMTQFDTNIDLKEFFGQSKPTFYMRDFMDNGNYVIGNFNIGTGDVMFVRFVAGYLITQAYMSAFGRSNGTPEPDRRIFVMTLDEAPNFLADDIAKILEQSRKYGLGLVLAHQTLDQLRNVEGCKDLTSSVLSNCKTHVCYALGADDASGYKGAIQSNPLELQKIPRYHTMIGAQVAMQPQKPFISKTLGPERFQEVPGMADEVSSLIIENTHRHWARKRSEIEDEIKMRHEYLMHGNHEALRAMASGKLKHPYK